MGACLQELPHHGGPAVPFLPWDPEGPPSPCTTPAWASGLVEPHGAVPTGALPHHGGPAMHVVRNLPAPCLPGLLLRLPQAAI